MKYNNSYRVKDKITNIWYIGEFNEHNELWINGKRYDIEEFFIDWSHPICPVPETINIPNVFDIAEARADFIDEQIKIDPKASIENLVHYWQAGVDYILDYIKNNNS